jgi:hypothetical protein
VNIAEIAKAAGVELFDYQHEAVLKASAMPGRRQRICLYYKTGAGKSLTALGCMKLWDFHETLVIAPPSTHPRWVQWGKQLGIHVYPMSHAKFRMPATKISRTVPVIADEMHLFGGHSGKGWKKLDQLGMHLQAPLILASATPNYNDAERCYCIQHILDPITTKGGFIAWLYKNCETEPNGFSEIPNVTGFLHHANAAEFLAAMPGVMYLKDDLVFSITDHLMDPFESPAMDTYGYDERKHRVIASQMEERHTRRYQSIVSHDGSVWTDTLDEVMNLLQTASTPVLVFCAHSTVAEALHRSLKVHGLNTQIVTGDCTATLKDDRIAGFIAGDYDILVGTASLATGTDGMDKVCDTLIIVDDTDDDALRRQLIGRIMPRGASAGAHKKQVHRLVQQ